MKYIVFLLLALFLNSCQEEEPDPFTSQRFIKFKFFAHTPGYKYYEIKYSFVFEQDDVKQYEVLVPIEFQGYKLSENRKYSVKVNVDSTTLPTDCFELATEQEFRAGESAIDSLRVILKRGDVLKQGTKRLRVELVSNADFQTFMPDSSFVEIMVGDLVMEPGWWDQTVEKSYLGRYSKDKYLAFVEVTGIQDFGKLDASEKRYYAIKFKRDLEKNPRPDPDNGGMMSVPIAG